MEKTVQHLGIIMDGNRRWAKGRELPSFEGHKKGAKKVKEVARWCANRGVKVLTLYAFSAENWDRSEGEVSFLMKLFDSYLAKEAGELHKEGVKLRVIGQKERLPIHMQKKIKEAEDLTRDNDGLILITAISYSGRDEIVQAANQALKLCLREGLPEIITEDLLSRCLYTAGLPDPDLIIRTSGEMRTSGFLMWQATYSELYFADKYWPDFSEEDLDEALAEYSRRQRRFGK
ncbi:MAG: di-trans,poly-cis-decaprenylcistransferase [Candidatus Nealsonbacteria bacterium]|nr:di-trans,poly-cis-decaprenylcistransferase [Candidatus Nealsonbacteria bacterium]